MLKTYTAKMPDGTILTRKSKRQFYFVAAVKVKGEPWGWVKWSSTFDGANAGLAGWSIPTLEGTFVGQCKEES